MSIFYCVHCDKNIDSDFDSQHVEQCELPNDDTNNCDYEDLND